MKSSVDKSSSKAFKNRYGDPLSPQPVAMELI